MNCRRKRSPGRQRASAALPVVLVAGFPAWWHLFPVTAAAGWSYRVYREGIPQVSALAKDARGVRYLSKELSDERGVVFRQEENGRLSEALVVLSKPDGLVSLGEGVVVGQEGGDLPVLWLRGEHAEALFQGCNVEGVAADGRYLYAIEDRAGDGRRLRFDPASKVLTVLRGGLGEGVAVCPEGQLFYVEQSERWVKRWQADRPDLLVAENLNAPGFLMCNDEALWITDDATHRARATTRPCRRLAHDPAQSALWANRSRPGAGPPVACRAGARAGPRSQAPFRSRALTSAPLPGKRSDT